jgi:hypothetical protein
MDRLNFIREMVGDWPDVEISTLDEEVHVKWRRGAFRLKPADVDDYAAVREVLGTTASVRMSLPGYFEQAVTLHGSIPARFALFRGTNDPIEILSRDGQCRALLGPASPRFLLWQLDSLSFAELREMFPRMSTGRAGDGLAPIAEAFGRVRTVRIAIAEGSPLFADVKKYGLIGQALLFNIAYSRGVAVSLVDAWDPPRLRAMPRRRVESQFPEKLYNGELLAYYNLALASDNLILSYLALYNVLEFFFLQVSRAALHGRIRDQIATPAFSLKEARDLDSLASLVRRFDKRNDELHMLTNVLRKYIRHDQLMEWLRESGGRSEYFTETQTVLGRQFELDVAPTASHASMANRIYHVRNALVHNKDGELARFVPFSIHESVLANELPLVLFLAERLIVGTGSLI